MSKLFGPMPPGDERANLWRSIVAGVVVFGGIGGSVLLHATQVNPSFSDISPLFQQVPALVQTLVASRQGGDIVVPPPVSAPPPVPEFAGTPLAETAFTAKSMLVKDVETGAVLFRKHEYEPWPMASITKLMSLLVLLEHHPNWTATTTASEDVMSDPHLDPGGVYTIDSLWHAAVVGSSNRAVVSLVDATNWPRVAFVERMNQKARELGLSNTVFVEPTGLEEGNQSTASDILILFQEAMRADTIKTAFAEKEYTLGKGKKQHHIWNTNWLLLGWIPHTFAKPPIGKTGYIEAAGYNFVTRVSNGEHELDVVVFGAESNESRFTEARDVAEWAFENFTWPKGE